MNGSVIFLNSIFCYVTETETQKENFKVYKNCEAYSLPE
jgi:hypothetical protein